MSVPTNPFHAGLEEVRRSWGWFLVLGIVLIVLGVIGMGYVASVAITLASVLVFGWLLIISGAVQLVNSFWARRWSGFFLHLLFGILEVIVGIAVVRHPWNAAAALTLFIATLLVLEGVFQIAAVLVIRPPNWGWGLFSGIISLILGVLLWNQWPYDALWFIGFCISLSLLFNGFNWVMFALAARNLPDTRSLGDQPFTPQPAP